MKIKIYRYNNSIKFTVIIKDKKNIEIDIKINQGEPIRGTLYSNISIIKNDKIEILEDNLKVNKRISSIICFKGQNI